MTLCHYRAQTCTHITWITDIIIMTLWHLNTRLVSSAHGSHLSCSKLTNVDIDKELCKYTSFHTVGEVV